VSGITDGDTARVDIGFASERVRFVGINAPEAGERGYEEARDEVARLIDARDVVLERDVSDRDQYGRLLRYVWVRDGGELVLVNLVLVEGGFARARVYGPDDRYAKLLAAAQRRAEAAQLGIWAPQ
jgi:micrococcal nuclease